MPLLYKFQQVTLLGLHFSYLQIGVMLIIKNTLIIKIEYEYFLSLSEQTCFQALTSDSGKD